MARGLEKFQERERALSRFGKDLTRRSRSKCELCGGAGRQLKIFELGPIPRDPEFNRCAFLCPECTESLNAPEKIDPVKWRFLEEAIWSEVPIVQVLAARILEKISRNERWAAELLDAAYFEPEIESMIEEELL